MLGDAAFFVLLADHEASDVLQEQQRDAALAGQLDEVRAFLRGLGEQDAVVGEDRHRVAVQVGEAAHQGGTEQRLELVEHRAVDQARDHLAHVERLLGIGRHHAIQLIGGIQRCHRGQALQLAQLVPVEVGHAASGQCQGVFVVVGIVVGHAAGAAVNIGTAEVFGTHHFTGGGLYQGWPGEEDGRLLAHHDRFVGHRWHVGTAGGARAHHHCNLRNAQRAHVGLVEEDPPEVLAVGEHFVLAWQVGAARVHQVDARQAVLQGDGLRTQVLLHRQRVVGTAFYRGVVGHDHAFHAFDAADAGDHARSGHVFAIYLMGSQLADFEERRARVQQAVDALARQQLATRSVPLLCLGPTTLGHLGEQAAQGLDLFEHGRAVAGELRRTRVDLGVQGSHVRPSLVLSGFR